MKHANLPIPILNPLSSVMEDRKVESTLAVICFMWGTREVWKCSVVIRKDTEVEEEEVEAEMAVAPAMGMA